MLELESKRPLYLLKPTKRSCNENENVFGGCESMTTEKPLPISICSIFITAIRMTKTNRLVGSLDDSFFDHIIRLAVNTSSFCLLYKCAYTRKNPLHLDEYCSQVSIMYLPFPDLNDERLMGRLGVFKFLWASEKNSWDDGLRRTTYAQCYQSFFMTFFCWWKTLAWSHFRCSQKDLEKDNLIAEIK